MKKFAWMLAMVLPMGFAFTSCGDDDNDGLTLDQTAVKVDYSKDVKLKASEGGCTWSSDNDFVASVDKDGKVTANHAGEAIITATKNGEAATCKVTVVATDNAFVMPYLAWGETMTNVEAAMGEGYVKDTELSDTKSLVFGTGTVDGYPWYTYTFTDNKLTASSFTIKYEDDTYDVVANYLEQRFKLIEQDEVAMKDTYCNANSRAASTIIVDAFPVGENLDHYIVTFAPNTETKAGSVEANVANMVKKVNSVIKNKK